MVPNLLHRIWLLCFSLIICLSVWQLTTDLQFQFASNIYPQSQSAPKITYPQSQLAPNIKDQNDYTRLIDMDKFEFTILNTSCNETSPLLLILIHSAPSNVNRRKVIRQTWGQKMDEKVKLLFAVGKVSRRKQRFLQAENDTYGDFIQGNFVDAYRNLIYKHAMVLKYAIYHCPSAKYILKVDDDIFVNLVTYMELLHQVLIPYGPRDLLFCKVIRSATVKRSYNSKFLVSFQEYSKMYYPDYCDGAAPILYSPDSLLKLYTELQTADFFWIDDVQITGILREKLNLTLQDNSNFMIPSCFFQKGPSQCYPSKPFLSGPIQMDAEGIWKMWNYTMKSNKNKNWTEYERKFPLNLLHY